LPKLRYAPSATLGPKWRSGGVAQQCLHDVRPCHARHALADAGQCGNAGGGAAERGRQAPQGSTILLLGVTYKKDSADLRETPAAPVAQMLIQAGARVTYCDPHVKAWTLGTRAMENGGPDVLAAVTAADLVILLQAHSVFCDLDITGSAQLLLDTRGITSGERL
jgi:UDP-N-acetyl-D-mannosaminuronate dehydrogenase